MSDERPSTRRAPEGTQSIQRALSLLREVARSPRALTLAQLGRRLGLAAPTAHRMLGALEAAGLIERDETGLAYRLGNEVREWRLAPPEGALRGVEDAEGETMLLYVRDLSNGGSEPSWMALRAVDGHDSQAPLDRISDHSSETSRLSEPSPGEGRPPLVVLHGLYGSSRNWQTAGRELAQSFRVLAFDLRNHGSSPHASSMTFPELAADVLETAESLGFSSFRLLGHSLGGKVAMRLACDRPDLVERLVVVDIAPRRYEADLEPVDAMLALDVGRLGSRTEADAALAPRLPDRELRQFLLTNLVRSDGGFRWQVNLPALRAALPALAESPLGADERYEGPALFLFGGRSPYYQPSDRALVERHFPHASIEVLAESGHNVHVDARAALVARVRAAAGT